MSTVILLFWAAGILALISWAMWQGSKSYGKHWQRWALASLLLFWVALACALTAVCKWIPS